MAWMELHDTLPDHPKVICAAAALKLDKDTFVGKLTRLWLWALNHRESGFLRDNEAETVAEIMRFKGRPAALMAALLGAGLLDVTEGGYMIHDWQESVGMLMASREEKRAQARQRVKKHREKAARSAEEGEETRRKEEECNADVTRYKSVTRELRNAGVTPVKRSCNADVTPLQNINKTRYRDDDDDCRAREAKLLAQGGAARAAEGGAGVCDVLAGRAKERGKEGRALSGPGEAGLGEPAEGGPGGAGLGGSGEGARGEAVFGGFGGGVPGEGALGGPGETGGARRGKQHRKAKAVPSGGLAAKNERPAGAAGGLGEPGEAVFGGFSESVPGEAALGGSSASAPGEGAPGGPAGKGGSAAALDEGRSEGFGSVCGGLLPEGLRAEGGRGVGKTGPEGGAAGSGVFGGGSAFGEDTGGGSVFGGGFDGGDDPAGDGFGGGSAFGGGCGGGDDPAGDGFGGGSAFYGGCGGGYDGGGCGGVYDGGGFGGEEDGLEERMERTAAAVRAAFLESFGREALPAEVESIVRAAVISGTAEVAAEGVRRAAQHGARCAAPYVKTLLDQWAREGVSTPQGLVEHEYRQDVEEGRLRRAFEGVLARRAF